ncbi:MAG: WD40 repeat domain-containing protein [Theionarchaea archaeon]|nr:WD40 repeat domain-containing protein [Theionarchaea archaeon]
MKKREESRILTQALIVAMVLITFSGCVGQEGGSNSPPSSAPAVQAESESPSPSFAMKLVEKTGLPNDIGPIYSLDWSPDGHLIATAGYKTVTVWSIEGGRKSETLEGHASYVWGVAWSPDGSLLASASQDGTVLLWNSSTYSEPDIVRTGWAFCVDWSPDGSQLAVGTESGETQIVDVTTKTIVHRWASPVSSEIISVAWSPDGKVIASGEFDGGIYIWNTETGQLLKSLEGYTKARCDVNGLTWSPDGHLLAAANQDGKVRLWNAQDWQLMQVIDAHSGWVRGVAWSPDGRVLASTGEDHRARFWDTETWQQIGEVTHNYMPVWSVAWSPDGTLVSTGSGRWNQLDAGVAIVWIVKGQPYLITSAVWKPSVCT